MIALGIDLGTQSVKFLVYDSCKHEIAAQSSAPLELRSLDGGVREQEAYWWIGAIDKCFADLSPEVRNSIDAISVSGQQHGFVPVDKDGNVLYAVKLWCDTSTAKECDEITESFGGEKKLIQEVGNPILPGYTASKILWFKKNHPDLYSQMRYVLLPHDYINYYFIGVATMERGDASGTGLLNVHTRENIDSSVCKAIADDLESKIPEIRKEHIIVNVREDLIEKYGLKSTVVVSSGGGDNMMSAIGTGTVSDGIVAMSLGTSGTLFASSSTPIIDYKKRLACFCSSHETWLPLLCTMNCTIATESMRHMLDLGIKDFDALAEDASPGAEGIIFLPFLNGERVPSLPNGKGVFAGLDINNMSTKNMARAVFEGVTFEFLLGLDAFRENGYKLSSITLTGGGAKSRFWRKLISDITGLPVRVPLLTESAAFGAALQAIWLTEKDNIESVVNEHVRFDEEKSVSPDMALHSEYMSRYEEWKKYVDALSPLYR